METALTIFGLIKTATDIGVWMTKTAKQFKNASDVHASMKKIAHEISEGILYEQMKLVQEWKGQELLSVDVERRAELRLKEMVANLKEAQDYLNSQRPANPSERLSWMWSGQSYAKGLLDKAEETQSRLSFFLIFIDLNLKISSDHTNLEICNRKNLKIHWDNRPSQFVLGWKDYSIISVKADYCVRSNENAVPRTRVVDVLAHPINTGHFNIRDIAKYLFNFSHRHGQTFDRDRYSAGILPFLGYETNKLVFLLPEKAQDLQSLEDCFNHQDYRVVPLETRFALARQLCRDVSKVHEAQLVHRNIRSKTILVLKPGPQSVAEDIAVADERAETVQGDHVGSNVNDTRLSRSQSGRKYRGIQRKSSLRKGERDKQGAGDDGDLEAKTQRRPSSAGPNMERIGRKNSFQKKDSNKGDSGEGADSGPQAKSKRRSSSAGSMRGLFRMSSFSRKKDSKKGSGEDSTDAKPRDTTTRLTDMGGILSTGEGNQGPKQPARGKEDDEDGRDGADSQPGTGAVGKVLLNLYLMHWHYVAGLGEPSSRLTTKSQGIERNVYRHPTLRTDDVNVIYNMGHDIYSLGVCLLEIGMWSTLVRYDVSKYVASNVFTQVGGVKVDDEGDLENKLSQMPPEDLKGILCNIATQMLPATMGQAYTHLVVDCLQLLDMNPGLMKPGESVHDMDPFVKFQQKVDRFFLQLNFGGGPF